MTVRTRTRSRREGDTPMADQDANTVGREIVSADFTSQTPRVDGAEVAPMNFFQVSPTGRFIVPPVRLSSGEILPAAPLNAVCMNEQPEGSNPDEEEAGEVHETSPFAIVRVEEEPFSDDGDEEMIDRLYENAIPSGTEATSPIVPTGYPLVSTVISDAASVARLTSSGLLMQLSCIPARVVLNANSFRVKTRYTNRVLSAYDQMLFAVASKYYALLPVAQEDLKTFQFLHMCGAYTSATGSHGRPEFEPFRRTYLDIGSKDLHTLVTHLSNLLIKQELFSVGSFDMAMPQQDRVSSLAELLIAFQPAGAVYKMVYQLVHGGIDCIEPVPELLHGSHDLSVYIDAIAKGNGRITPSDVIMLERPSSLPTVPFRGPATTAIPPTIPSLPVTAQASNEQTAPLPPLNFGLPSNRSARTRESEPNRLINQTPPARQTVTRNTTEFRDSVFTDNAMRTMLTEIKTTLQNQAAVIESIQGSIQQISAKVVTLDVNLGILIGQHDARDLRDRGNINRTLVQPVSTEAREIVNQAPTANPPAPTAASVFISRIEALTSSAIEQQQLSHELKSYLTSLGHVNLAANLGPNSFSTPLARQRWCVRLSQLA